MQGMTSKIGISNSTYMQLTKSTSFDSKLQKSDSNRKEYRKSLSADQAANLAEQGRASFREILNVTEQPSDDVRTPLKKNKSKQKKKEEKTTRKTSRLVYLAANIVAKNQSSLLPSCCSKRQTEKDRALGVASQLRVMRTFGGSSPANTPKLSKAGQLNLTAYNKFDQPKAPTPISYGYTTDQPVNVSAKKGKNWDEDRNTPDVPTIGETSRQVKYF
jgi:hypothetical protein